MWLQLVFCYRAGNETGEFGFGEVEGEVKICGQPAYLLPSGICLLVFQRAYIIGTRILGRNPIKTLQSSFLVRFSCLF